jgi:hypothetical protein
MHSRLNLSLGAASAKPLVEAINAPATVDNLLLASIERVAYRTHIDVKILAPCGTGLDGIAATAGNRYSLVLRMYICFHTLELLNADAAARLLPGTAPLWGS